MLADISPGEIWMISLTAAMVVVMAIGTFFKKSDVNVQQPLDVQIIESLVSKDDFGQHTLRVDRELTALWNTMRTENTAIRREITDAVTHSQEVVTNRLDANRAELNNKLDGMPERIIATLKNTSAI